MAALYAAFTFLSYTIEVECVHYCTLLRLLNRGLTTRHVCIVYCCTSGAQSGQNIKNTLNVESIAGREKEGLNGRKKGRRKEGERKAIKVISLIGLTPYI